MEDIHFLEANSEREAYLFQSDSSLRDKTVWPTPSEYSISFDSPFTNVIGFDVIDASVPRTQYTVDVQNNSLAVSINGGAYFVVKIEVGDHTDTSLIDSLNSTLRDHHGITVSSQSNPSTLTNAITFTSTVPFEIDMDQSTCQGVIGFNELAAHNRHEGSRFRCNDPIGHPNVFSSLATAPTKVNAFTGNNTADITTLFANGYTKLAQRMLTVTAGLLTDIRVAFHVTGSVENNVVQWTLCELDQITGNPGDVVVQGSMKAIDYYVLGTKNSGQSNSGDITDGGTIIRANSYYWLVLECHEPNIEVFYGGTSSSGNIITSNNDGVAWSDIEQVTQANFVGNMTCTMVLTQTTETLKAPGILNLTGEPYIMLRVPEIESHLYRSRAFEKYAFGVAKFTMGVVGFANDRFDYSSVPPRTFHPIGKLQHLTFQFRTASGNFYDFKGVDHQLVMVIRYLRPTQKEKFNTRLLNPRYEPDEVARARSQVDLDDTSEEETSGESGDDDIEYESDKEQQDIHTLKHLERGLYKRHY